jgi:hypothetical protein
MFFSHDEKKIMMENGKIFWDIQECFIIRQRVDELAIRLQ